MHRLICLPAIALSACGVTDYQRPRTVEYITEAILAPNCGNAQCHSSFRNEYGYAFDTVANVKRSFVSMPNGVSLNAQNEAVGDHNSALLYGVLVRTLDRMPYDQPLPDPDIELIAAWIDFGARGAQCSPPTPEGGTVCAGTKVVECKSTFEFGAVMQTCATGCVNGACQ
jgi:hypothetical protein